MDETTMPAATPHLPACLLDPRVLAITPRLMVWDVPADRRALRLVLSSGEVMALDVPWPRLLLSAALPASGVPELHVVALKRQGRAQEQTPVFHAPLMNLDREGKLLGGEHGLPTTIDPRRIDEWEHTLLEFSFTLVGHDLTLRPADMAARAQINSYHHCRCWREIARAGLSRFPGRSLVPRRQTVEQWITSLQERVEQ
jgi:PRTRC genetic system protein B